MTNDKENYIGKQCVENKEANEIFSFLEGQMSNFSAQFNGMCKKVTYSIFASSWATIFALIDNEYRIWLLITILLCILFFYDRYNLQFCDGTVLTKIALQI